MHRTGFLSRFFYIAFDIRPVGYGLAPGPGLVRIAEGIHVRIRADTGVAKQIPGTAYCLAPLKDQIALVRTAPCQRPGHPYPGQTGTYDDYIEGSRLKVFLLLMHAGSPAPGKQKARQIALRGSQSATDNVPR